MFTFHWSELLVVVLCGLILLLGLALVMLRRRNEILQVFLTPEDSNIEEDFFRVRKVDQTEPPTEEDSPEADQSETAEDASDKSGAQWGNG